MKNARSKHDEIYEQEQSLEFCHFNHDDALKLGLSIIENSKKYSEPVALAITLNGMEVFRYFAQGAIPDSVLWLKRKNNSIQLMRMSSLRFFYWLNMLGYTLEDRKLDVNEYAADGGGFPISIKGTGVIGSVCVSGLTNHLDDHALVVDSIKEYLKTQSDK